MSSLLKPHMMGILFLLISFGAISAVILTPALPELSRDFGISESKAQLTMSLFLIAYAFGQLPYGPIANRFGRKKAVYIGIGLMLIGSVLALSVPSFAAVLLGRLIQALGAAVGLKITLTMISDRHEGPEATKAISMLSIAFAIMPAFGVTIGGYLVEYWGWRGCFVFSSFYAGLLGLLVLALPETGKAFDQGALETKRVIHGYLQQFKSRSTMLNAVFLGFVSSSFYIFATVAPYVGIVYIGLSPGQFGLWNLIPCVGVFMGVWLTWWFAQKNKPRLAVQTSIGIMIFAIALMILSFSFSFVNVWTLFIPVAIMRIGSNTIWSNAASSGLSASHDKSNTSAVMQFINLSMSTIAVFVISAFPTTAIMLLPLALGVIIFLLLMMNTLVKVSQS